MFNFAFYRYLVSDMEQTDYLIAGSMVAHWLCYFNSAINPVIYNFMSRKSFLIFPENYT